MAFKVSPIYGTTSSDQPWPQLRVTLATQTWDRTGVTSKGAHLSAGVPTSLHPRCILQGCPLPPPRVGRHSLLQTAPSPGPRLRHCLMPLSSLSIAPWRTAPTQAPPTLSQPVNMLAASIPRNFLPDVPCQYYTRKHENSSPTYNCVLTPSSPKSGTNPSPMK